MQNRYAGDAGDFGKLGLLRQIAKTGLSVGVNWYLTNDETHNDDGKHIGYLTDPKFKACDDELLGKLGYMVYGNLRSVKTIEESLLIPNSIYYSELLANVGSDRDAWHNTALETLKTPDIVFLDPDNGLLPKSVSMTGAKSIKYVFPHEITDYYRQGNSVIFYNHRSRMPEADYIKKVLSALDAKILGEANVLGLKYVRGTLRDYFFLVHDRHYAQIQIAVGQLLESNWSLHFERLPMPQGEADAASGERF